MPPKICNAKNAKTAKNAKKAKKAKNANLLQSATQSATTKAYSTTMGRAKKQKRVGGGGPPRGASILFLVQEAVSLRTRSEGCGGGRRKKQDHDHRITLQRVGKKRKKTNEKRNETNKRRRQSMPVYIKPRTS